MKNILVLCPTEREFRNLTPRANELGYNLIYDDFGGDYFDLLLAARPDDDIKPLEIVPLIDDTIATHKHQQLQGVTSAVGYPGMSAVSVIAKKLGLPGPKPECIMLCEHKYY